MKSQYFIASFLVGFLFLQGYGQNGITSWRGPNENGIYPAKQLLQKWKADGPEISWKFDALGIGYSSPVVSGDRIYLTGMEGETGYVYALDKTGKLLWKSPYGEEFSTSYPGARSSPTLAGEFLYMLSGTGRLVCMQKTDGKIIWSTHLFEDYDGRNIQWGVNETVVVDNENVYCTPGGKRNNVIALNRFNGRLVWSSPAKGEVSAYCTPLLVRLPGRKLLVTITARNIVGLDADTGLLLWSHPQTNRWSVHANTPIYHDGAIYCFSGYGQGGVKLLLNADGSKMTRAWFNKTLDNRIGGAILVDGYIYGSGDNNREWQCVDWKTGEQKYATKEIGKGVIIAADGLQFWYSERGELALVRARPDHFEIISKTRVSLGSGQHWAHPVIDGGHLYLRHGDTLIAYKIS